MSIRSAARSGKPSRPLDLPFAKFTQLSIRTLNKRHSGSASVIDRVRGEFAEMRGFSPTLSQAARLFGLSLDECRGVFAALVKEGRLLEDKEGRYRLLEK